MYNLVDLLKVYSLLRISRLFYLVIPALHVVLFITKLSYIYFNSQTENTKSILFIIF